MEDLNRTQFVYKRELVIPEVVKGEEIIKEKEIKTVYDSFNVDCIIRCITMDDGRLLVLLDDLHERWQELPKITRNGKRTMVREKDTFQSEIYLSEEDGQKLLKLTAINDYEEANSIG